MLDPVWAAPEPVRSPCLRNLVRVPGCHHHMLPANERPIAIEDRLAKAGRRPDESTAWFPCAYDDDAFDVAVRQAFVAAHPRRELRRQVAVSWYPAWR